ncbi:hypothetical protein DFH09DRAFT_1057331 [Mycena vulgaris]|nr:hypothetical protein DFH09DRAFT_1057331 [Mycena vulgaris]
MSYHRSVFNNTVDAEDDQRRRHSSSNSGQWPAPAWNSGPAPPPTFSNPAMSSGYYAGPMGPGPGYPPPADYRVQPHHPASASRTAYPTSYIDPRNTPMNQPPNYAPQPQFNLPPSNFAHPSSTSGYVQPATAWPPGPYNSGPSDPRHGTMPSAGGSRGHRHSPSYPNAQIILTEASPTDHGMVSSSEGKVCSHCRATTAPLWRRDPRTHKTLCNACGLYLYQNGELRPQKLIAFDAQDLEVADSDGEYDGPECANCGTRKTSTWRRDKAGAQVCNACGVFERMNGRSRPLALRNDKIRPRTKH